MQAQKTSSAKGFAAGTAEAIIMSTVSAGLYWLLFSENASENRGRVREWISKAKDSVENKVRETFDDIHEEVEPYMPVVEELVEKYKDKATQSAHVAAFLEDLHESIHNLQRTRSRRTTRKDEE